MTDSLLPQAGEGGVCRPRSSGQNSARQQRDKGNGFKVIVARGTRRAAGVLVALLLLLPLGTEAKGPPHNGNAHPFGPADEANLTAALEQTFRMPPPGPHRAAARKKPVRGRATLLLRDLRLHYDQLSPAARQQFGPLLLRPDYPYSLDYVNWGSAGSYTESTVSSTNFVVHYVSSPMSNASYATASFANEVLATMDNVATVENGTLGWPPPPSDGFYTTRDDGGDGRYDIYLADVGGYITPIFGYTAAEEPVPGAPGSSATSYMVLDNDFAYSQFGVPDPLDALRVTAAHEYNHACQYGLDYDDPETWFYESTAVHMEDLVYDSIDDYVRFLPGFFDYPDVSLRFYGSSTTEPVLADHPYGATVWNHYLARRYGTGLELGIWEDTATGGQSHPQLFQTMQSRLTSEGTSLADEFGQFAAWNYLTAARDDPSYYPEGSIWPEIYVNPEDFHADYPASRTVSVAEGPEPLAASYLVFVPPAGQVGRIVFTFQGDPSGVWRLWRVGLQDGVIGMNPVTLNGVASATDVVDDMQRYAWITYVPSNVTTTDSISTRRSFAYTATFESTLAASNVWLQAP